MDGITQVDRAAAAARRFGNELVLFATAGTFLLTASVLGLQELTHDLRISAGLLMGGGLAWIAVLRRRLHARAAVLEELLHRIEALASPAPTPLPRLRAAGLGHWGQALDALAERMDRLQNDVAALSARARELPDRCHEMLRRVAESTEGSASTVDQARSLLGDLTASIQAIRGDLESLSGAAEEASSSILELGSSITEIARNAEALERSVDSSTAAVHQMSGSMHQVAASADAVQEMAEETAAAMTEMDRAVQEVSEHVREASQLTERVSQGAEDGSRAVASTIEGIQTIRALSLEARDVLGRLVGRIGAIGEIVTVIGSVNEETNLLALNAAIIAAQAGEQGKAFAVVANHVKTLADRTAHSTQEIGRLIEAVQGESTNAVRAMGTGIEAVESGVARSRRAGDALEAIRRSAREASSRVAEIARAALEQSRNSKHVAEAARKTSDMVQEISRALTEQRRASDQLLRNAEAALETCRHVHRATKEQRESSAFVAGRIGEISDMIHSIQESTEAHARASEALEATVLRFLDLGRRASARAPEVMALIEDLARQAEVLEGDLRAGAPGDDGSGAVDSAQAPGPDRR